MDQSRQLINQIVQKFCVSESASLAEKEQRPESQSRSKFLIKKASKRFFNNIKISPFLNPYHHVYTFLKSFSINQSSLKMVGYEENIFRSWFYHKVVTKVQKYQNAVVISAIPSFDFVHQPEQYSSKQNHFLEKLKYFHRANNSNLITILGEILQLISKEKKGCNKQRIDGETFSVTKILNSYGNEMFICKLGLSKFAISNTLLEYLGIDLDQFCIQTIKYRTVLFDFLSSNSYPQVLAHCFSYLRNVFAWSQGKITKKQLTQSESYYFKDFIYGKNNMKSYCEMQVNFPRPEILIIKILKVHYQTNELNWKRYGSFDGDYSRQKQRVNQKEFSLLYQLQNEPENGKEKSKVAGYVYKQSSG